MVASASAKRKLRWWYVVTAGAVAILGVGLLLVNGSTEETFRVRYQGQLCTEYKDTKVGVPVHVVCPSDGHESWIDTMRQKKYPRGVPVEYLDQSSNDR